MYIRVLPPPLNNVSFTFFRKKKMKAAVMPKCLKNSFFYWPKFNY